MIASDQVLTELVKLMNFETEDHRRPFNPAEQIQPASIDLRLDRVFWKPRSSKYRRRIDLRKPLKENREIEGFYQRIAYNHGDGIVINPGELIHGRIYESFQVPVDYIAEVKGRSSFARLGLAVHCTGDFINPGWRGQMPLQLVNHGKVPIVLTPYVGICQLVLTKLLSPTAKPYGSPGLGSKYMDDKGSPSRYWEDARHKKLQAAIGRSDLAGRVRDTFSRVLSDADPDVVDRFHVYIDRLPIENVINARDVLEQFARVDTQMGNREELIHKVSKWLPFALFSTSLGVLFKEPYTQWHYTLWAIAALLMIPGGYFQFFAAPPKIRFKLKDVQDYFRDND